MPQFQGECNLDQLAELMFRHGKKERASIELGIEQEQVDSTTQGNFDNYMYSILIELAKYGTKMVFDIDNILTLDKQQVETLSEYFYAINYSIYVTANNSDQEPWTLLEQGVTLETVQVHFNKITLPRPDHLLYA